MLVAETQRTNILFIINKRDIISMCKRTNKMKNLLSLNHRYTNIL